MVQVAMVRGGRRPSLQRGLHRCSRFVEDFGPRGGMTRRALLQAGGLGLLGLSLGSRASAGTEKSGAGQAKSVIFLYLSGGPSQFETFDPKPDAPVEIRGSFKPIATRSSRRPHLRASAEDGRHRRPARLRPLHVHQRSEPRIGRLLGEHRLQICRAEHARRASDRLADAGVGGEDAAAEHARAVQLGDAAGADHREPRHLSAGPERRFPRPALGPGDSEVRPGLARLQDRRPRPSPTTCRA